jgi:DNA-binding transcriptional MerR regulator
MKMQRRLIRIGELAKQLNVENFVIRFWEKEFSLKGHRSPGGQRFYDAADLAKFCTIKELLYDKVLLSPELKKCSNNHKLLPLLLHKKQPWKNQNHLWNSK